jgi:hypothetical protein
MLPPPLSRGLIFTSVIVRADLTLAAPAENEEPQYDARRVLEIRKEAQR